MSGRETLPTQIADGSHNHSRKRPPHPVGGMRPDGDLVGDPNNSAPRYLGHFRLAGMARQILVDEEVGEPTMGKGGNKKKASRTMRPNSSGDIRLAPKFRNPVDIERLGKALVAIALKQTVEFDGKAVKLPSRKSGGVDDAVEK